MLTASQTHLHAHFRVHRNYVIRSCTGSHVSEARVSLGLILTIINSAPYMRTSSYIMLRLAVPILCYAIISFFYAMINLPFKVHFGARYTHAGGFFLWWVTLWLGMGSVYVSCFSSTPLC